MFSCLDLRGSVQKMAASKEPKKKVERKFVDASTKETMSAPKKATARVNVAGGVSVESKGKAVPFRILRWCCGC